MDWDGKNKFKFLFFFFCKFCISFILLAFSSSGRRSCSSFGAADGGIGIGIAALLLRVDGVMKKDRFSVIFII